MMFIFRSTFITAVSAFVMALCLFSMSASAAPQFGRPMLHALDEVTVSSGTAEPVPTSAVTSTGTDPEPDPQVIEAATPPASSASLTAPAAVNTSTNGASKSLCGGMSVVLGVAVSGVWLML
ncbi:uncharacterized protein EDB91DRAFT_363142 [Suillus paluster]|uniref:uncharacterized protein n=1 Tax=Suillus paluster TaxID=48578 RepID=UPI001B876880|nr:uncharacterized protein EDB91DRAFT_363142 [Suillus paluster]KAG1740189.1 hypothetical protein EDB91DRAFT_363142 [Suillus paluster]